MKLRPILTDEKKHSFPYNYRFYSVVDLNEDSVLKEDMKHASQSKSCRIADIQNSHSIPNRYYKSISRVK